MTAPAPTAELLNNIAARIEGANHLVARGISGADAFDTKERAAIAAALRQAAAVSRPEVQSAPVLVARDLDDRPIRGEIADDQTVYIKLNGAEFRALRGAAQAAPDHPAAWIAFADNGNVRFWTSDPHRSQREKERGLDLRAFTMAELIALISRIPAPSSVPSAQCNCHPYIADTYGHDKSCPLSSTNKGTG